MRSRSSTGLTLVELLVVVFVLALLAQTAVLAGDRLLEASQREATLRLLEGLERAVVGEPARVDSQMRPYVTGFVADVGSLPVHVDGAAFGVLAELWERPTTAAWPRPIDAFAVQNALADGDPEVRLACGWRGPYLRTDFAPAGLVDGHARPFAMLDLGGLPTANGTQIAAITSFGADGTAGGTGYDADLELVFASSRVPPPGPRPLPLHLGSIPVQVEVRPPVPAQRFLVVRVYGPRNGRLALLAETTPAIALPALPAGGAPGVFDVPDLTGIPIGPRVVRAYLLDADPLTTPPDWDAVPRSRPQLVTVEATRIPVVELAIVP